MKVAVVEQCSLAIAGGNGMKRRYNFSVSRSNPHVSRPTSLRAVRQRGRRLTTEHPALDVRHVSNVSVRTGLKSVGPKVSVTLRLDADVLAWFKSVGPGYQGRINAVLRAFKESAG